jgi:hypothetical protein
MIFGRNIPAAVAFPGFCESMITELGDPLYKLLEWGWLPIIILITPGSMTWGAVRVLQVCRFEFLPYLAPNVAAVEVAEYVTGWWWLVCGVILCLLAAHNRQRAPL